MDLIFTKGQNKVEDLEYKTPIGKSDHIVINFIVSRKGGERRKENHRKEWLNYSKTNFCQLRKFFGDIDWKELYDTRDIEKKYDTRDIEKKYDTRDIEKK